MAKMRMDRLLAELGFGSRKEVGQLLRLGRAAVDGQAVRSPSFSCDPQLCRITVDGNPVEYRPLVYLMMNKPAGVLSASRDSRAQTVVDLVPEELLRRDLFPAGRLDKDTTGLLILTNDGQMAHRMLSPHKEIPKTYLARLEGPIDQNHIAAFAAGVVLHDGTPCLPAGLMVLEDGPDPLVEVVILEGKYHQIKRMFGVLDRPVLELTRRRIGGLTLDESLEPGQCRPLTQEELSLIFSGSPL